MSSSWAIAGKRISSSWCTSICQKEALKITYSQVPFHSTINYLILYIIFLFDNLLHISISFVCACMNAEGEALTWDTRLKIVIEAAEGLNFLHNSEKSVIYRDFKASNILLDSVKCRFFVIPSSHTFTACMFLRLVLIFFKKWLPFLSELPRQAF